MPALLEIRLQFHLAFPSLLSGQISKFLWVVVKADPLALQPTEETAERPGQALREGPGVLVLAWRGLRRFSQWESDGIIPVVEVLAGPLPLPEEECRTTRTHGMPICFVLVRPAMELEGVGERGV